MSKSDFAGICGGVGLLGTEYTGSDSWRRTHASFSFCT